jgi:predicted ester cyclase
MIDADDFVTTRYTSTGTHKGELRGIAATNKTFRVEGVVINRISRGRIAESWVMWDALGLMQQLGVVPALEKAKAAVSNK